MLALACLCLLCFDRYISPYTCVLDYGDAEFTSMELYAAQTRQVKAAIEADPQRQGDTAGQRVFLVSQGDNGLRWFNFSYEFLPMVLDYSGLLREKDSTGIEYGAGGGTFGTAELYNGDVYYHAYSPQQFWKTVQQCGCAYVFVQYSDSVFEQSYAALFSDGLAAAANGSPALYRVDEQQGLFVPVAMTEGAA